MGDRTDIPDPTQREVRQRCGFGCVICGVPIYEYHHMEGDPSVHNPEDITLLCPTCHARQQRGWLTDERIRQENALPLNKRRGMSTPFNLEFAGASCSVSLGSNNFVMRDQGHGAEMVVVMVDGIPLVGFVLQDGHLGLYLRFYDAYNWPTIVVENNVLVQSAHAWDIQWSGKTLTLRAGLGLVHLVLDFLSPDAIVFRSGRLLCNGVLIAFDAETLVVTEGREPRTILGGNHFENLPVCLAVGYGPPSPVRLDVSRYNEDWGNADAALRVASKRRRELQAQLGAGYGA